MIQVYEYYISHHLAKAFESLFGSVTCLPGCFCMYRLRTADKGKPLIISDEIIKEYSDCEVDTLHKKNLLSLGEDRFLTTIMLKHFPKAHFKFVPNALALTAAPEQWSVLLSQRRRWINSTIHNLFELVWIDDLCGFCMFSMRFVVFVDLVGTIILPATVIYLVYLIVICSTTDSAIPYISIAMIAGVYGLQAVIFLLKRQWQHIGWMIIYLMAYPVYSFILPLYSFWNQDNFSWGNTRVVIGEKGDKKIVAMDDEGFDPRSIPLQRWDDYAMMNGLPGRRTGEEKFMQPYTDDAMVEMDDMRSMYSSIKPASTILTGFPAQGLQHGPYATPPSPYSAALGGNNRMSSMPRYTDQPGQSHLSVPGAPYYDEGRLSPRGALDNRQSRMSAGLASRPMSSFDLRASRIQGPDDGAIIEAIQACLADVDLDTVTKKQVRALVEQRLQTSLTGERRAFLDKQIDVELARM
ncbi:chitin synthase [Ascosphaera apis ARSEF 7405]|uniref:chitin synthase n=1 Tax=Ascosphaera apis ARSEF 7405 TaxID=392613 RepID=A0A168DLI8_9EURO|nr:chitin synthase [Ascosphaera apis ARSEF 7405]